MAARILIVDDDAVLRSRLTGYLAGEGYRVTNAGNGAEMRDSIAASPVDLVILDLMMPGEDGLTLTRFLRERSKVGILILTGKSDPVDRVVGLEMGADDYLPKPFELRELLARVRSILRRVASDPAAAAPSDDPAPTMLTFDGWRLDCSRHGLMAPDGREVHVTTAEYKLLEALARNPNRALDRDRLMDAIVGRDWQPFDRSIDLHVSNLRQKIENDPRRPQIIKTVRGAGYMLAARVARE
jgi:two-component system phosphate regulon response regulator OmpR